MMVPQKSTVRTLLCLTLWSAFVIRLHLSMPVDEGRDSESPFFTEIAPINDDEIDSEMPEKNVADAGEALRQSSAEHRILNPAELQELAEQANANVSQSLSNTSLADLESDNLTQLLQSRYRERKKQERLMVIQAQILQRLRMSRQPNISSSVFSEEDQRRINAIVQKVHIYNNNNNNHDDNGYHQLLRPSHHRAIDGDDLPIADDAAPKLFRLQTTMQWLQSFYPSCSLQNNTDRSVWELPGTFRVYYDLPLSRYLLGSEVTVLLAKLRLYKYPNSLDSELSAASPVNNMLDVPFDNGPDIFVSVYQLMRPLRLNKKERKRLVDSQSLTADKEGWIEFNVVSTLNYWLHHSHRNYGFDVQVEDVHGNKLDPNLFFRNLNCSSTETATQDPPFPNLMEIHPEMIGENESSLFDNETYPTLDLQTADVTTTIDTAAFRHLLRPSPSSVASETPSLLSRNNEEPGRILRKRHLHDHSSNHNDCQKETIYVSFSEIGLGDVVIAPKGFHFSLCSGTCVRDRSQDLEIDDGIRHLHSSSLMQRVTSIWKYLIRKPRRQKELSCVASGMKSLPILYFNEHGEIHHMILEDLIPTSCSCRTS